MMTFLIALGIASLFVAFLFVVSTDNNEFLCVVSSLAALACIVAWGFVIPLSLQWVSAKHKADILNREYGTDYTQAEVFYAADVIDTVRQLDRKRYEINGNLLKGE